MTKVMYFATKIILSHLIQKNVNTATPPPPIVCFVCLLYVFKGMSAQYLFFFLTQV